MLYNRGSHDEDLEEKDHGDLADEAHVERMHGVLRSKMRSDALRGLCAARVRAREFQESTSVGPSPDSLLA